MTNIARDALEVLRSGGWTQGTYASEGKHCAVGAIVKAMNPDLTDQELYEMQVFDGYADYTFDNHLLSVIEEQYPDRLSEGYVNIPHFNDHPNTTFEDIEKVFEKAAIWIDEQA